MVPPVNAVLVGE